MTTAGSTKAVRKDVARNRALLVEAAREVFAERGLDATLDEIAARAGVGTGTAYRHFANKQELAVEVLTAASEQIVADARNALSYDDAWEGLVAFFDEAVGRMAVDRGLHDTLVQQRGGTHATPLRAALVDALLELFTRAQNAGQIRPDADPTDMAPIFGMMGVAFDMGTANSPELWRRYLAVYLDGLRTDKSALPTPALALSDLDAALAAGKRHSKP